MNDANKNIRSDEVEQALEILSNEGDDAMEEYLFPRGMNWIELYLNNMRGNATQSLALIKTIRDNLIFKDAEDIKLTPTFNTLTVNAAEIVRRAAALKEIFLSHFGVDLDEERTKVCLDNEHQRNGNQTPKSEGVDIGGLMELLYEQFQEISNYLTDLHEATTALGGPGGTLSEVRKALYTISDHTLLAATILNTYQEEHQEEK